MKTTKEHTHTHRPIEPLFLSVFLPVFDPECVQNQVDQTPKHLEFWCLTSYRNVPVSLWSWMKASLRNRTPACLISVSVFTKGPELNLFTSQDVTPPVVWRSLSLFYLFYGAFNQRAHRFTSVLQNEANTGHNTKPDRANTRNTWSKTRHTFAVWVQTVDFVGLAYTARKKTSLCTLVMSASSKPRTTVRPVVLMLYFLFSVFF